jgi:hypothetical protein
MIDNNFLNLISNQKTTKITIKFVCKRKVFHHNITHTNYYLNVFQNYVYIKFMQTKIMI